MISIVSLIYKSSVFAKSVYKSLHKHTPMLESGEAEFFFVANGATLEVIDYLRLNKYPYEEFNPPNLSPEQLFSQGYAYPDYINRVYKAWNFAIQRAKGEIVCLLNSDHFLSPNWLENLLKHLTLKTIVVPTVINPTFLGAWENVSHFKDFGKTPESFLERDFLNYCQNIKEEKFVKGVACGEYMPCLFYKSVAEKVGYYPEGNIAGTDYKTIKETGDKNFYRKLLEKEGVEHVRALDSFAYHLTEGEMRLG